MSGFVQWLRITTLKFSLRTALAVGVCLIAAMIVTVAGLAAAPAGGTLTETNQTVTWTAGPFIVPNASAQANGTPTCVAGTPLCDEFSLTVNAPGLASTHKIAVQITWTNQKADFDLYVFQGNTFVRASASQGDPETVYFDIPSASTTYTIRVAPFSPLGDGFSGTAALVPNPPPPAQGTGIEPRYQTYLSPVGLGNSAGEPSIGVDWNPNAAGLKHDKVNTGGVAFFTAGNQELRVSFDDAASPAAHLWENVSSPFVQQFVLSDPIGFVDHQTGRMFQLNLIGGEGNSFMAYSDDDGATTLPAQGGGAPAGPDHETLGGGPYAKPEPAHPTYPNAIYYCSQNIAGEAECSRSDDGGLTFGPGIPIFQNAAGCLGGIHGHVKVAPDGTVYVPNSSCSTGFGTASVTVSADNGVTWTTRTVPGSNGNLDPSVGIGQGNTIYLAWVGADGHPYITVSKDRGEHWVNIQDVGTRYGIQNSVFPVVVAGDDDRAAFGFLGTPAGGNYQDSTNFKGIWHLYIATTFDGGGSYVLTDATPSDPVQVGAICTGGTLCSGARNLLDFNDITIDKEGRVLLAYADGCLAPACTALSQPSASRSKKAAIARQAGGRRLLHAFDPPEPTAPAAPQLISATRTDAGVDLVWAEPDNGGSPLTGYKIYRGLTSGGETLLASIDASKSRYMDTSADASTGYFYKVRAVNAIGEGPSYGELSVAAPTSTPTPTPSPTPTASPTPTPPTTITPVYEKGGIGFSPNVALRASVAGRDGEPSLRVDKFGNAYVAGIRGVPAGVDLWHFDLNPNSPTYDPYMRNPIYRGQPDQFSPDESIELGADGGGDVDLAVGFDESSPSNPPYLAFSSLVAANVSTARSTDRGKTFTKNPAGNVTGGIPADDRQWMEFYGKDSVYLLYRTLDPAIAFVQRSNDGGLTYGAAREVGSIGQVGGISVDQTDGTVYVSGANGVVAVGVPQAPGLEPLTYTIKQVVPSGNAHIFFTVKAAKDGTVYVCYSNGKTVFIKYSVDKGNTWSQAIRVSDGPETATSVLPWMETGPVPGSIGVVWYGTTESSNNDNANWKVFFAQSLNAKDAAPVFRQVELSDHFIHGSNVSEGGLPLLPGGAPNRNLLDYFQIGFDPTGAAVVAYTDDHNDFDGHTYVARQISGPGVKGSDIPAPVEGGALPQPTPRPADAPQVLDYPQDMRTGLLTVLPMNDPLDILSVKYSTEPSAQGPVLVATMKVSDLSIVPPLSNWRMSFTANAPDSRMSPTGDYSFGLSDRGDQFFLRATTDALGNRTFVYGTAVREHQHRGFIAYTDKGAADAGSCDSATNTITVKISLEKLNAVLNAAGHTPIGPGSILAGLRGSTFTTGDDNAADRNDRAKSDITRGGTQYAIDSPPVASLSANPTSGTVPLTVNFDGSGSSDPDPDDTLTYTFDFGDGSATVSQASPTVSHTYGSVGSYTASLKVKDASGFESSAATVGIQVNAPPTPVATCLDDDSTLLAYSSGWHMVNNAGASGGHFRLHNGKDSTHFVSLNFSVPEGQTGSLTYSYAKSTKGGSAEVFIDGVSKGIISYKGSNGDMRNPEFSGANPPYEFKYGGLAPGQHKFELRNLTDTVYIDGICIESSSPPSTQPATGPGQTSSNTSSLNAGQQSSSGLSVAPNTKEISVLAVASGGLPIKLILVDPAGLTLKTVDSTGGVAVLNAPVSQSGLYTIKVVNVSLGPIEVWTVATPFIQR